MRFHGLFHDDMMVYREDKGRGIFNWQYVSTLFDALLDCGIRPFVELGFCPRPLATKTPPVDPALARAGRVQATRQRRSTASRRRATPPC